MDAPAVAIKNLLHARSDPQPESFIASFRDPSGQVFRVDKRVFRLVDKSGTVTLMGFLASRTAQRLSARGMLIESRWLSAEEAHSLLSRLDRHTISNRHIGAVLEHEPIPFPSFPCEWSCEMLAAAADLTLDVAEGLLDEGLSLKDATPYNILFRGPQPVFVDVLSAEQREPIDPTWLPYGQFVRTFLIPLLLDRFRAISASFYLASHRDGIEPRVVYQFLSFWDRLRSPALTLVTLPAWLARKHDSSDTSIYRKNPARSSDQARFILRSLFRSLRRSLAKVSRNRAQNSEWTGYMEKQNYSAGAFELKRFFVERALEDFKPDSLLDVGCNTGFFSMVAARKGIRVVAIDSDPVVIGKLWDKARQEAMDILPLVVNLAQPTPATGWRNRECPSFLQRARQGFDGVFMLALVHHLLTTEGIPLHEIFRLAHELTRQFLIIEYVDPADPMFIQLARGRETLFETISREAFEAAGKRFFDIVRANPLGPTRLLYVMVKKKIS